ncbi:hypothetical protein ACFQY5_20565 [Paeniroseomonas aquatica]|uniref:hypothetical protein n=1 Tax=Paeniroseomonas aquatica TaxID=373043 RepID=UPI00361A7D25
MQTAPYDRVILGDLVLPDGILAGGYVAVRGETIAAIGQGRRHRPPRWRTTAACSCCPGWSTGTCTPPPAPAGRGSRAPRCRPRRAASPPASTCPTTCRGR